MAYIDMLICLWNPEHRKPVTLWSTEINFFHESLPNYGHNFVFTTIMYNARKVNIFYSCSDEQMRYVKYVLVVIIFQYYNGLKLT